MSVKQESPLPSYDQVWSGEVEFGATATQFPDIRVHGGYALIKANPDNVDAVYVGGPGVTVPDTETDTTSGYPLAAGEALPPLVVENLSQLYGIAASDGDAVSYLILK